MPGVTSAVDRKTIKSLRRGRESYLPLGLESEDTSNKDVLPAPKKPLWRAQLSALGGILCQPLNILLVCVPFGLMSKQWDLNEAATFALNFFAIIPLASILGAATEALSSHTGQILGGLLNATFGNAVEMIMCCQAVRAGLIQVVQGNLLGSVLSNLLLVLGMAIVASGMARKEQKFNAQGAAANMTCQLVASIAVCLPTVFRSVSGTCLEDVLHISRICAFFLIALYGMFLFFMLHTHADLFSDEGEEEGGDSGEELSAFASVLLLFASTVAVAGCSEGLVDSIDGVSRDYGLPKAFIGVILLPIVGNAAEHTTAVVCAYKGLMDLALGVAVGSSTQIALFVVPCAVMYGWACDEEMSLSFRGFDTTCQMLAVFLVAQCLQGGTVKWIHGVMLILVYFLVAVHSWFIPEG